MDSGRVTAWSRRGQRTCDSVERACTADVWQRVEDGRHGGPDEDAITPRRRQQRGGGDQQDIGGPKLLW